LFWKWFGAQDETWTHIGLLPQASEACVSTIPPPGLRAPEIAYNIPKNVQIVNKNQKEANLPDGQTSVLVNMDHKIFHVKKKMTE